MQTSVEIEIANGVYPCAIGLQGVREIELACKAPIGEVIARIMKGRMPDYDADEYGPKRTLGFTGEAGYYLQDCVEFVRQALIGAAALGMKPVVDGVTAEWPCTPSRANEVLNNYLLPPIGNLDTLWSLAAFVALNLAEGYIPPEKKSQSETAKPAVKRKPRRKTDTLPQ